LETVGSGKDGWYGSGEEVPGGVEGPVLPVHEDVDVAVRPELAVLLARRHCGERRLRVLDRAQVRVGIGEQVDQPVGALRAQVPLGRQCI
jgi:hypothetical protein